MGCGQSATKISTQVAAPDSQAPQQQPSLEESTVPGTHELQYFRRVCVTSVLLSLSDNVFASDPEDDPNSRSQVMKPGIFAKQPSSKYFNVYVLFSKCFENYVHRFSSFATRA